MAVQNHLRYLLSDGKSLYKYFIEGLPVSLTDVKRSLMLVERENNIYIPDHHYRLGSEMSFDGIKEMSELFTVGLAKVAGEYLESKAYVVYVKEEKMNDWQMLLPYIPPLILVAVKIWKDHAYATSPVEYITKYLIPNFRYTALPVPYIRHIEEIKKQCGLYDLHIHLNGALETDTAWQDFILNPDEVYHELIEANKAGKVKEQYLQFSPFITPLTFRRLLQVARVLRARLCERILSYSRGSQKCCMSLNVLLANLSRTEMQEADSRHPISYLIGNSCKPTYMEALFYVLTLDYLCKNKSDDYTASLFHYYLLILGQTNKMLVQQPSCFGFEEFQKYTMNGYREFSEKKYKRRFLQLAGNRLENIHLLEGRFSPKDSLRKEEAIINKIECGWNELEKAIKNVNNGIKPELRLVAHFIKKADTRPDEFVRHKWLRHEIMNKAQVLVQLKNSATAYSKKVVGIDAAASEFDAPPEVFAPAYRYLREHGYEHFTYHAGEDFFHILSGLRAIYEAIEFLGLERGDRIGHASAAGISISVWRNNIGERLFIRQGEYLDNLIFAYHLIEISHNEILTQSLPKIALKINYLAFEIYNEHIPLRLLIESWECRYKDPEEELKKTRAELDKELSIKYLLTYHWGHVRKRYDKIIEIETFGILDEKDLTALQLLLLEYMSQREIIIETLPTSNVFIGVHHNYKTYHLYNWLEWKRQGKRIPPIVVGTDDPGIFATNIYNEYCNIYCQLVYEKKINAHDAILYLRELHDNSCLYAFVSDCN